MSNVSDLASSYLGTIGVETLVPRTRKQQEGGETNAYGVSAPIMLEASLDEEVRGIGRGGGNNNLEGEASCGRKASFPPSLLRSPPLPPSGLASYLQADEEPLDPEEQAEAEAKEKLLREEQAALARVAGILADMASNTSTPRCRERGGEEEGRGGGTHCCGE